MKRFLFQVFLLGILTAAIAAALALGAYREAPPKRFGGEVFRAIRVCTSPTPDARVLVLGDSVATQLFGTGPATDSSVAVGVSNQAVTPIGNRILLERWLALNPQAGEVVYLLLPQSLVNDGTRRYTFHYLIHPFSETGLLRDATDEVREHLARRFGRIVLANASLRHLLYANDRLYDFYERRMVRAPGGGEDRVPGMVVEQLRAMKEACDARGVRFRLAFPPVSESKAPSAAFRVQCADALRGIFPEIDALFGELRVEPDSHFRDGVHFTKERLAEIQLRLRGEILAPQ